MHELCQSFNFFNTLLRALGAFLQATTRSHDVACRYGGEEFALILPGTSLESARRRAEQVWAEVRTLQVAYRNVPLGPISLSLGVAAYPDQGRTAEAVLDAADAALYRAKDAGRNQVVTAERRGPTAP